jgi:hypothetical protein
VRQAMAGLQRLQREGLMRPTETLTAERTLIEIRQVLQKLERELILARSQLAALINIPPDVEFKLLPHEEIASPVMGELSVAEMISEALFNRPELREFAYKSRINEQEITAYVLEALPGFRFYANENTDGNRFLLHYHWASWGATAAWNVIRLAQLPVQQAAVEAQRDVLVQQSTAMALAIITQVYISRIRLRHYAAEFALAKDAVAAQRGLINQLRVEAANDRVGVQTVLREEMHTLVAEAKRDIAYANLQTANANLSVSLGLDLQLRDEHLHLEVDQLSRQIASAWTDRGLVSQRWRHLQELAREKVEARRKREAETVKTRLEQQTIIHDASSTQLDARSKPSQKLDSLQRSNSGPRDNGGREGRVYTGVK